MISFLSITTRSNAETPKINEVYLIAPKLQEKPWDKAIVCDKAPFNSVCMSEIEYRLSRKESKILEIEKANPCPSCPECPDQTSTYITIGGVSFSLGVLLAAILVKK